MGRVDEITARYEAELKEAELLDRFTDLKAEAEVCGECGRPVPTAKDDPRVVEMREVKAELRAVRAEQRAAREATDGNGNGNGNGNGEEG